MTGEMARRRGWGSRTLTHALVAFAISSFAIGAAAQAPAPTAMTEPAGYRELVTAAVAEHEAGHFSESRSLFEKAHALFPNARTFRGLGMSEFELRNYGQSALFLEQALNSPVKPLEGALRDQTAQLLSRANGFVGRFMIQISPQGASVVLNGNALHFDPNLPLLLSAGDYVFDVSAEGYQSEQRSLRVAGGEQSSIAISLTALPAAAPAFTPLPAPQTSAPPQATQAAPDSSQDDGSVFSSPWFWIAAGAVAVGAGVGIGFVIARGTETTGEYDGTGGVTLEGP